MKKHTLLLILLCCFFAPKAKADEGMWLLQLLSQMNYGDMKNKGLKLSAEQIYSINKASLKDAVVSFGGFCTGEIISKEGLVLTNHHCGFGQIQSHSTVEKNYLVNGFWAMKKEEELPNEGLFVTFIVRVEDVTAQIMKDMPNNATEKERQAHIREKIKEVGKNATEGTHYETVIRPFFYGNEYYMFVTETHKDVRLVGTPPNAIGKFGGDTDNWMWPRHTGDFSLFRVYTAPDGKPATYSKNNVPLKPKYSLPISMKGIKENDFTMVMGFPGRTQQYISSYQVQRIIDITNPKKIRLRTKRLEIFDKYMKSSAKIHIQYAAKQASVANAWKKWIGESKGLKRLQAIKVKEEHEQKFMTWAGATSDRKMQYGEVMNNFKNLFNSTKDIFLAQDYVNEAVFAIELFEFAMDIANAKEDEKEGLAKAHFKDYYSPLDEEVMAFCLETYAQDLPKNLHPAFFAKIKNDFQGDYLKFARNVIQNSVLADEKKYNEFVKTKKPLSDDIAVQYASELVDIYRKNVKPQMDKFNQELDINQRAYVKGMREMNVKQKFYPDANSTLRLAFGVVKGYEPYDGGSYDYQTYLEGIMEKEATKDVYEDYAIPAKLRALFLAKDYGQYAEKGKLPICFTASNHTTGGNSGSPVLNAKGELIGINFDRTWESTMSDIMYDANKCRNVAVDIRYVLFVIDKYAGAGHLVKEMELK